MKGPGARQLPGCLRTFEEWLAELEIDEGGRWWEIERREVVGQISGSEGVERACGPQ